ncbi:TNF receptor-associated factor 2-like isoform X2 [Dysidea avara]
MVGCDWTELLNEIHLDSCQFVTVECENPGCGEQVLMSDLESHLKEKCLYRQVECADCGKMPFIELQVWRDFAVKSDNYMVGRDWTGLLNELMKNLDGCQFKTIVCKNSGCGKQVLLSELEEHLKENCSHRQVECKDCGKKMSFIELQEHTELCPNAPKVCGNCKKKIPVSEFDQHITKECKHIQCVCKEKDAIFEVDSDKLQIHLEDISKLGNHLAPMITEFSKMLLSFQEMTAAYQTSTQRIEELEIRNKELEKNAQESNEKLTILTEKVERLPEEISSTVDSTSTSDEIESVSPQSDQQPHEVASGCPEFAKLSILDSPSYVKEDVIHIEDNT